MLKSGLLNPALLSLVARVRHTNTLVIADRDFPFWPMIETVDLALIDNVPTVLQVLGALQSNFKIGRIFMAQQFHEVNSAETTHPFTTQFGTIPITYEDHDTFKLRVPHAIGLIRTADTVPYANMILESA